MTGDHTTKLYAIVIRAITALDDVLAFEDSFKVGSKGDPVRAVRVLRDALSGEDWPPNVRKMAASSDGLFRWLRGSAQTDAARLSVTQAKLRVQLVSGWKPALDLQITEHDLKPGFDEWPMLEDSLHGKVRTIASFECQERAMDFSFELIIEPPPSVPVPRPDLFKTLWSGSTALEVSRSEISKLTTIATKPDGEALESAAAAIDQLVPDDNAPAVVTWTGDSRVSIVSNRTVRAHWQDLIESGSTSDTLLFPPDVSWFVCYFHHDYLEVARRSRKWGHRLSLP